MYINPCLTFNKTLTNLTSLRQYHLQYTGGFAETQGLLLPSLFCDTLHCYSSRHNTDYFSSFQNFHKRFIVLSEQLFLSEHGALKVCKQFQNNEQCPASKQRSGT
jgi:hypothetical protein